MKEELLEKLDYLTLDLNFDLTILYNAVKNADEKLEICMLENFIERIYKNSEEIRKIFYNEIL